MKWNENGTSVRSKKIKFLYYWRKNVFCKFLEHYCCFPPSLLTILCFFIRWMTLSNVPPPSDSDYVNARLRTRLARNTSIQSRLLVAGVYCEWIIILRPLIHGLSRPRNKTCERRWRYDSAAASDKAVLSDYWLLLSAVIIYAYVIPYAHEAQKYIRKIYRVRQNVTPFFKYMYVNITQCKMRNIKYL